MSSETILTSENLECRLCGYQLRDEAKRSWYLCQNCLLFQKVPLPQNYEEDFVENKTYRAESQAEIDKTYAKRALAMGESWEYYASKVMLPENPVVLDFGSGNGAFLEAMRQRNIEAVGIEPSKKFADLSNRNGLNVVQGYLHKETFPEEKFDVIHLRNSLYFIQDLKETFEIFNKILKPEGYIFCHGKQFLGSAYPARKEMTETSWVAYYFSNNSLYNLFSLMGFEMIYFRDLFGAFHLVVKKGRAEPQLKGSFFSEKTAIWLLPISEHVMKTVKKVVETIYLGIRKWKK